jgi:hypothetical protein
MKPVSTEDHQARRKQLEFLAYRKQSYQAVFMPGDQPAAVVLADLSKFCRAGMSTFHPDPRIHALQEGRKEVWLRIAHHLNLTEEEMYYIFHLGKQPTKERDDDPT